jgi:hypothetical protein
MDASNLKKKLGYLVSFDHTEQKRSDRCSKVFEISEKVQRISDSTDYATITWIRNILKIKKKSV